MKDIVIEVSKGMVTNIFCDSTDVRFIVVDWDLRERQAASFAALEAHEALTALSKSVRNQIEQMNN